MERVTTDARPFAPFFNVNGSPQGRGGQIKWSRLNSYGFNVGKFTVKLGEAVSIGETDIVVDALSYALKKGTVLDFGTESSVVVTLSGNEAIGQTNLSVTALSGALPAGAILDFGSGENIVKLASAAAAGATAIDITEALTVALESGDTATYQGGDKQLRLAADADAGATSITVEPAPFAIADDSEAFADKTGDSDKRLIPAGTIMSRLSDGYLIPRSITDASEPATEVLRSDAVEDSKAASKTGWGTIVGGILYENLCPDADGSGDVSSTYKTELNTAGCTFQFTDFIDSRTD